MIANVTPLTTNENCELYNNEIPNSMSPWFSKNTGMVDNISRNIEEQNCYNDIPQEV